MNNDQKRLNSMLMEKKSLPECARKRMLDKEIQVLQSKLKGNDFKPKILVKYSGKVVGVLDYNEKESSWIYESNDGSCLEVGFKYEDARTWASINGFHLKVVGE